MNKRLKKMVYICGIVLAVIVCEIDIFASEVYTEKYILDTDVKELIDLAIESDEANSNYIQDIKADFNQLEISNEEYNELLIEAVALLNTVDEKTNTNYQKEMLEFNKIMGNSYKNKSNLIDLYTTSLGNYGLGIKLVSEKNCPQTAEYMSHAVVPYDKLYTDWSPSTYYHRNDSWSKYLIYETEIYYKIFEQFEEEILMEGAANGSISGTFAFTSQNSSLDAFAALHKVDYVATFTQLSTGGYSVVFKIIDTYDFAWGNYENFAVGFGNNYCYNMQSLGFIKPFKIVISGKM